MARVTNPGWIPRPVSDRELTVLRGWLTADGEMARASLSEQLAAEGDANGLGTLVYAGFVIAARRRFTPQWTRAEVIAYVARLRAEMQAEDPGLVDPLTAEDELRAALGDPVTATHEAGFVAAAKLFIMIDILVDLDLDARAMTDLLGEIRASADHMLERISH
jgi:hypothetical protein